MHEDGIRRPDPRHGSISPQERQLLGIGPAEPRAVYESANQVALLARDTLRDVIESAAPGIDSLAMVRIRTAMDTHARAQVALFEAAQLVCDVEELEDRGAATGIKWSTPL